MSCRARARFAAEKSDILTDVRAYDECMRVRQEESPSAMRAFCSDVRPCRPSYVSLNLNVSPTPLLRIQNYISATTVRDISVLRNDLLSALASAGLVQVGQQQQRAAAAPELNTHAGEPALLKALLLAALYPHVARVALPRHAVKFSSTVSGTVARDAGAREWRATDMRGARVWVHPASTLFAETRWRSGIVVSFERVETAYNNKNSSNNNSNSKNRNNKVYLRDVTEVRLKRSLCCC